MKVKFIFSFLLFTLIVTPVKASCPLKDGMPLYSTSQMTQVAFLESDNNMIRQFDCSGSQLRIVRSQNSFQVQGLEVGNCGEEGPLLNSLYTATINFNDEGAYYYDRKGKLHILDFTCTDSEILIELNDRPVTWVDPWRPGPQRWKFMIEGTKVNFQYEHFSYGITLQVKAKFQ